MGETARFHVPELDCAEEVNILRGALEHRDGILALDFDLLRCSMRVTYEPEAIAPDAILAAVEQAGLEAAPWEAREAERPVSFWGAHGRLIMTAASGALLAVGFAAHWILHGDVVDALTGGGDLEGHRLPLIALVLYAGAMVTGAWYVAPKAVGAARRLQPDMHLLMLVAVIGAMAIGEWFEAGTVAFLFALALLLEHWSVGRARRAIAALMDLSPETARYVDTEDGDLVEGPVEDVRVGMIVVVRPGEKVPLDGRVLRGRSRVNQAPITGESFPVLKEKGDSVYAGTINEEGTLEFEVTRPAGDTTLARIIHMVRESQAHRAPAEQWIERFARAYTPAMMALAVGVALGPPLFLGGAWTDWVYRALVLLVIACPCALVISTPVSVVSGLTSAARNGVLIKGGVYLEAVGRLRAMALDKTGTLTYGRPRVQRILAYEGHTEREVLERAASVEADSVHPLADAIIRRAEGDGVPVRRPEGFRAIRGEGAEAWIEGRQYWVGSHRMMEDKGTETEEGHRAAEELEDAGHSVVAVGSEGHVCGLISIADELRPEARQTVDALKRLGIRQVVMLTGDNEGTARAVARDTGVDAYHSELLPEDKVLAVRALVDDFEEVAMVGDGVNDAPAMAAARVGIAMGAIGSDAAIETADVTLMSDEIGKIPWLVAHSRRTLAVVKQNVTVALGVKAAFLALALFGAATLWMAIAADMGASLLVIFNGLRLLRAGGARPAAAAAAPVPARA